MARRTTPIHTSLTEVPTLGGVEYPLAIFNGTVSMVFLMGMNMPWFIIVGIIVHVLLSHITKRDPHIRKIYQKYITQGWRYDPWPSPEPGRHPRPDGFAPLEMC